ncbi:MAG: transketolase C-terminal domain-containing protein [Micromonosporaceae bacterium]
MTSAWDLDSSLRTAVSALQAEPPPAPAPDAEPADEPEAEEPGAAPAPAAEAVSDEGLSGDQLREWYEAMLTSRQLDLAGYWLRSWNEGYHAVSSAGHEATAAVAAALRPTDPALLYPRSGGFYCARANQVPASDPVLDVLGAVAGVATEPMAGGRHVPYGSRALTVVPTTGVGASHLPRAMGLAFALDRSRRLGLASALDVPEDSVVAVAFGGDDVNHATATATLNAAGWCGYAGLPMPLLFVCQDDTDTGWVAEVLGSVPALEYFAADGCELPETYRAALAAAEYVRRRRKPAVLHLDLVRLMDHGTGPEVARDPLLLAARRLVRSGAATGEELVNRYDEIGWRVRRAAEQMVAEPRLGSAQEVLAPLSARRPLRVAQTAAVAAEPDARTRGFGEQLPEAEGPLTVAQSINRTLGDALAAYPQLVVFGPEVTLGGSDGVTEALRTRYGAARVFDTFPDETSVLGLGLGCGLAGLLPVAEVPRLAQLHNGLAQLRDEGASTQFFSQGAYRNPLVVRVPGFAAPDGYGGHAYNENAVGALREIPGLVVAAPARPDDAAELLRTCLAAAATDGTCCVYVEPAPLYHTRDLHTDGDGGWLAAYPAPERWVSGHVPIGRARVYGDGAELTVVTYGDALRISLRVVGKLAEEGVACRVVDLRWLAPLPLDDVVREAEATGRVLVVDPARRSGGVADAVLAGLTAAGYPGRVAALASEDSYTPLGPAAGHVLVTESAVEQAARGLLAVPS